VPGITYFSFSLVSPGQLASKGEHASFADAQEYDREYRPPNVKRDHMWLFEL
jgi:hypothetical protein